MLAKYTNYADILSFDLAIELTKNTKINKYVIELMKSKQSPYCFIYAFILIKLETLEAYIKTDLRIEFIRLFKSLTKAPIIFDEKSNGSFYLYIDYQGLYNLNIKISIYYL